MNVKEEIIPSSEALRKRYKTDLRRALNNNAINITAFAGKVGTSQSNITKILSGESYPSRKLHKRINDFLGIDLVYTSKYTKS